MSGGGFTSPFGANSNPFGPPSSDSRRAPDNASSGLMQQVIEEDENDVVTSPTSPFALKPSTVGGPSRALFPPDSSSDFSQNFGRSPPPGEYPAQYNFARRTSVSAESLKPVTDSYDNWSPPVHQKTTEQLGRLKAAIQGNFLFSHLDEEQSSQILGALMEKPIPTKGIKVSIGREPGDQRTVPYTENADASFVHVTNFFPSRLSHKVTRVTFSMLSRKAALTSMSTAPAPYKPDQKVSAKRWTQSRQVARLVSWP